MKFSQIPVNTPTQNDFLVGVSAANVDYRFPVGSVGPRIVLKADTTFFYATTGSDSSGDGTAGNPFATPQHTWNYIAQNIDAGRFNITIKGADGTYPGADFTAWPPNMQTLFNYGNLSDHTKVVWQNGGESDCWSASANSNVSVVVGGITFDANTPGCDGIFLGPFINLQTDTSANSAPIGFTASGGAGATCFDMQDYTSILTNSDVFISGAWSSGIFMNNATAVFNNGATIHLVGTPSFSQWFVNNFGGHFENDGSITGTSTGGGLFLSELGIAHFNTTTTIPGTVNQVESGEVNYQGLSGAGVLRAFAKSGLPATTDIANGACAIFEDTSGSQFRSVTINDSGTLLNVASNYVGAVSGLPAAGSAGAGARGFVNDSTATLAAGLGNIVAGLGGNFTPVYSDGTNWRIG